MYVGYISHTSNELQIIKLQHWNVALHWAGGAT